MKNLITLTLSFLVAFICWYVLCGLGLEMHIALIPAFYLFIFSLFALAPLVSMVGRLLGQRNRVIMAVMGYKIVISKS